MSDIDIKHENDFASFLMMATSPITFPIIYGIKFTTYYLGLSDGVKMTINLGDKFVNEENIKLKDFLKNKEINDEELDNYVKEIRKIIG